MNAGKWEFQGYQERNYGKSALYVDRSLTIDASSLPHGITLAWAGGDASHARVLAVYGDLTMNKVTVTGGYSDADRPERRRTRRSRTRSPAAAGSRSGGRRR